MSEPDASPIPEPDTPAPGLEEPAEEPAAEEPAAEEEPAEEKVSHAERLRGLFSEALTNELVSINDRLDKAGL